MPRLAKRATIFVGVLDVSITPVGCVIVPPAQHTRTHSFVLRALVFIM